LRNAWAKVPQSMQAELAPLKDILKTKFTA
jgi:hypothetical protein